MSSDMTFETWRVECEDGVRDVLVSHHPDGWWNAADEINGRVERRVSTKGARDAVVSLAAHLSWSLVSIAAPGQLTRGEIIEDIDGAVATLRQRTLACQRLASATGSIGDSNVLAAAYEHAWRIVREETGR